ncbi:MAG: UDP-N-acetylmuramoyl-L-alanine--D-glutamate ligase [Pseudomonadota bacterium]
MSSRPLHDALAVASRVFIWGAGVEGLATARYLNSTGSKPKLYLISDTEVSEQTCAEMGVERWMSPASALGLVSKNDVLLRSPGVPLKRAEVAGFVEAGGFASTPTNLAFERVDASKIILVTGTKGKSTTASLLAQVMATTFDTALVGNIGSPFLEVDPDCDWIVLELSSYQCADLAQTAHTRILTNLYPEHLDWHGSIDAYYTDKTRPFATASTGDSWLNAQERAVLDIAQNWTGKRLFDAPNALRFNDDTLVRDKTVLGACPKIAHQGRHMKANALAALSVGLELGVPIDKAITAVEAYGGLPHRQEILGESDGVLYVNDSISTIPQSALAALERFANRPVHLLVGGKDRGVDPSALLDALRSSNLASLTFMGETAESWKNKLGAVAYPVHQAVDLETAVTHAQSQAQHGDVILLSPAAASYDQFSNFQERGAAFRQITGFAPLAPAPE